MAYYIKYFQCTYFLYAKCSSLFTRGTVLLFNTYFDNLLSMSTEPVKYNLTLKKKKKIILVPVNLASYEDDEVKNIPSCNSLSKC